jgi:hypothetical protein
VGVPRRSQQGSATPPGTPPLPSATPSPPAKQEEEPMNLHGIPMFSPDKSASFSTTLPTKPKLGGTPGMKTMKERMSTGNLIMQMIYTSDLVARINIVAIMTLTE